MTNEYYYNIWPYGVFGIHYIEGRFLDLLVARCPLPTSFLPLLFLCVSDAVQEVQSCTRYLEMPSLYWFHCTRNRSQVPRLLRPPKCPIHPQSCRRSHLNRETVYGIESPRMNVDDELRTGRAASPVNLSNKMDEKHKCINRFRMFCGLLVA
jgi:hypothetical protein